MKIIQQRAKEDMKVGLVANSFCSPNTADIAFRKAVYLAVCVNLSAKNCGSQQRGKLYLKRLHKQTEWKVDVTFASFVILTWSTRVNLSLHELSCFKRFVQYTDNYLSVSRRNCWRKQTENKHKKSSLVNPWVYLLHVDDAMAITNKLQR